MVMSSAAAPTKSAFVHQGTWADDTRKHPAVRWMEEYDLDLDTNNFSSKWYGKDWKPPHG
jgi:hypothetical protein